MRQVLCASLLLVYGYTSFVVSPIMSGLSMLASCYCSTFFQVSLSCKNGIYHHRRTNHYPSWVFSHSTDYVELYRVVDYQQSRSLPQQLFGLKTVTIYSGDRNNAKLDMIGIKASNDIVSEIRCRVEFNKKNKGIYEITNRS